MRNERRGSKSATFPDKIFVFIAESDQYLRSCSNLTVALKWKRFILNFFFYLFFFYSKENQRSAQGIVIIARCEQETGLTYNEQ